MREKLNRVLLENVVWIVIFIVFCSIVVVFFPYQNLFECEVFGYKIIIHDYDKLAQFISGITGPILSLLTIILVYATYKSQKEEYEKTKQLLNQQQFETTFFNLLNLHHEIVKNIDIEYFEINRGKIQKDDNYNGLEGRNCFEWLFDRYREQYDNHPIIFRKYDPSPTTEKKAPYNEDDELKKIINTYHKFQNIYQPYIGHYFRNLNHIIECINRAEIENKKYYIGFVRAQLSTYEQVLLLYNCLWYSEENNDFLRLVKDHCLLKNLDPKKLIDPVNHIKFYQRSNC